MNIKDIALLAETSVATVSRVINMDAHVSEKARQRVIEVIEATGYRPDLVGRALKDRRQGQILALLPSLANPFYPRVLEGLEHRANAGGYDLMICVSHRDYRTETRYLNRIKNGDFAGAVALSSALADDKLDEFAVRYPLVQCGAFAKGQHICYTCIDNVEAGYEAVSHLIKLGNRQIALMNGAFGRPYETDRETGYKRALQDNGIPVMKNYMAACDYNFYDGYECCKQMMRQPNPPTAFFCSCDQMAAGTVKYLLSKGLTPGKDVDVIGFDGTYLSELCTPSLSVIEQPGYEMGKAAFDLLLERIQDNTAIIKKVIMPHRLVLRQSTRAF